MLFFEKQKFLNLVKSDLLRFSWVTLLMSYLRNLFRAKSHTKEFYRRSRSFTVLILNFLQFYSFNS